MKRKLRALVCFHAAWARRDYDDFYQNGLYGDFDTFRWYNHYYASIGTSRHHYLPPWLRRIKDKNPQYDIHSRYRIYYKESKVTAPTHIARLRPGERVPPRKMDIYVFCTHYNHNQNGSVRIEERDCKIPRYYG